MKPASVDLKTEAIRASLHAIAAAHAGFLNPHVVVDAARDPLSPLHDEFEWDDSEAADLYRLAQAGALVRRMRLTIMRTDSATQSVNITTTRAYQSRQSQRARPDGGHEGIEAIMRDKSKRKELVAQVLRELESYRHRYSGIDELREIWDAVDEAKEMFEPIEAKHQRNQPSAPSA
jgi:hypothetical protein